MKCNNKFWLEDPRELFCSINLAPLPHMSLEEQMNSLSRLIFIIFLILLVLDYRYDLVFLLLSFIFIIILYYVQRKQMNRENFIRENFIQENFIQENLTWDTEPSVIFDNTPSNIMQSVQYTNTPIQVPPSNNFWCDQNINVSKNFNDPNYISSNQKLAQGANPRTKVAPIIVNPIADTEYWRPTDLVVPRGINDQRAEELYQSGYITSNCCESQQVVPFEQSCPTPGKINTPWNYVGETCRGQPAQLPNTRPTTYWENPSVPFPPTQGRSQGRSQDQGCQCKGQCQCQGRSQDQGCQCKGQCQCQGQILEPYTPYFPYQTEGDCVDCCGNGSKLCQKHQFTVGPPLPGQVLTSMGYNPDQLELHNIPSNLAVGKCQMDNAFNCHNKDIFTNIIQPGIFARSEIIEPINSNIGISFDQQFEPVTCEKDCKGGITFVSHDPRLQPIEPREDPNIFYKDLTSVADVYDPRFNGYGTSYRSYIEPVTGQPRFYYDDVDAIKKYNYITRNNIDFADYATSAGPMTEKEFCTQNVRAKAAGTFTNDALNHRTDMQERLMRKINANAWQQKAMPIRTNVYNTGGGGPMNTGTYAGPRG